MLKRKPVILRDQGQDRSGGHPKKNVAADVSRLKLPSLAQLFECSPEKSDPAHAGCYEKSELHPGKAAATGAVRGSLTIGFV